MRGSEYGVEHWIVSGGPVLLSGFLERKIQDQAVDLVSNLKAIELIGLGSVYVNGSRAQKDGGIKDGDQVRAHLKPRRFYYNFDLRQQIVKTHDHYYLVDKPGGLPSHALVDNRKENLVSLLEETLEERLYITHRLDVATSGLIVIARQQQTQSLLNQMIREHRIERTYVAWTEAPVPLGLHVHFMEPSPRAPKNVTLDPRPNWLRCELRCLSSIQVSSLTLPGCSSESVRGPIYKSEIKLFTGRSQQIRAQLRALGTPIIGDLSYGSLISLESSVLGSAFEPVLAIALRSQAIHFPELS